MYINKFLVQNIRSITAATLVFHKGEEAGWHVILGPNGAGKSSLVRAFALLMMGEREAIASRQEFAYWMREKETRSSVSGQISGTPPYDLPVADLGFLPTEVEIEVVLERKEYADMSPPKLTCVAKPDQMCFWTGQQGWFSASFGPFRRFSGGDSGYDQLFESNKRLASHLTALGEDVALTDAKRWLTELYLGDIQRSGQNFPPDLSTYNSVVNFLNKSGLLPHQMTVSGVARGSILLQDGNGFSVLLEHIGDGYRAVLSMVIELLRQMFVFYGAGKMVADLTTNTGQVLAPGIVVIDEVDVHLHPTWQRDIGKWLTRCFPQVQFIVTTHSPIVCRAIIGNDGKQRGSVWRLPAPGENDHFRQIVGEDLDQLLYGDILDAYATGLFGKNVLRSPASVPKLERLAELNLQALQAPLNEEEAHERRELRRLFPAAASQLGQAGA